MNASQTNRLQQEYQKELAILNGGGKPPSRFKNKLQRASVRLLAWFFALMLAFTLLSRASDSFTMAVVSAESIKSGVITKRSTLSGVIKPLEELRIYLPPDLTVTEVKAGKGRRVEAGDVILTFGAKNVAKLLEDKRNSLLINGLRLELTEHALEAGDSGVENAKASLRQAESDYQKLILKREESRHKLLEDIWEAEAAYWQTLEDTPTGDDNGVTKAREAYEDAAREHEKLLSKLAIEKTDAEEALAEAETALREAENAGEADMAGSDTALAAALASLEQAQNDYDRLVEKQAVSHARAEEDLAAAEKTLADARAAYDKTVLKAREDVIDKAEKAAKQAASNAQSAREQAKEAVDNAQSAYDKALSGEDNSYAEFNKAQDDAYRAGMILEDARATLQNLLNDPNASQAAIESQQNYVRTLESDFAKANEKALASIPGNNSESSKAYDALKATTAKWNTTISEAEAELKMANTELAEARSRTDFSEEQSVISAKNALDSAERSVQSYRRSLEDNTQNAADQLLSSERSLATAQKNYDSAAEGAVEGYQKALTALADLEASAAEQTMLSERSLEAARKNYEKAVSGVSDTLDAARKAYDDNEASYTEQLQSSQRTLDAAKRSLDQAEVSEWKSRNQSEIDRINYITEKKTLEEAIAVLEAAADMDGVLTAPVDGTIQQEPPTGRTQETVPAVIMSDNAHGFYFEAVVTQSVAEGLTAGDGGKLSYTSDGRKREVNAVITGISAPDENDRVTVSASLPEGVYPSGVSGELTLGGASDRQNAVLPLSALRSDADGDFVLVLREKKTVLGVEYTATRMPVSVTMRDSELMAVQSGLSRDDKVITTASKSITEGDRVRLE